MSGPEIPKESMNELFNDSEQLVYDFCKGSFMCLWSYPNPLGKDGKELCDILVVCDPDIIVFSVKDVRLTNSGDLSIDWTRWRKRAIEASAKQIYGAERWLQGSSHVIRSDGSAGIKLPDPEVRRVHRVAVALGGQGGVPVAFGDFGKGFVHVFNRTSLDAIMGELDTVEDFVAYLSAKEELYLSGKTTLFQGGEEDLLALYLYNGRQFPGDFDQLIIDDDLWTGLRDNEYFKAKNEADSSSYAWDRLVETLSNDILHGNLEFGPELDESEIGVRTMARESRFGRRVLGKSLVEFLELTREKK